MKNRLILLALLAVVALGSGCALLVIGAAAGAGAGTVVYVKGELHTSEAVSFDQTVGAVNHALKDLAYNVTEKKQDTARLILTAYGPGSKKAVVTIEKSSATVTEIAVRVGTFGDEAVSHQIMDQIHKHL